jgi:hypothetical protein
MIEYKWQIISLYTAPHENGLEDVVKSINWRFQAKEDTYYGDIYDVTDLSNSNDAKSFIKYEDLKEETIVEWIKNSIDYDDLILRATNLLNENKNPSLIEKQPPFTKNEKYTGNEEYLIVFDDDPEKIWGPMKWNTERANKGLEHYGVLNYKFPFDITMYQKELLPTSNEPFIVSEKVKLYLVEYTEEPSNYDNIFEYSGNLTWVLNTGKAVGTYFIHKRSIDEVKELLISKIAEKFFISYNENSVEVDIKGLTYKLKSNYETQLILSTAKNAIGNCEYTIVKFPSNNTYLKMSYDDINKVIEKVHEKYISIAEEEKQIVDFITNSSSLEDLKTIKV